MDNEQRTHEQGSGIPQQHASKERAKKEMWSFGPILLILVGLMWLLNNLGLDWAGDIWFPLILVAIGAYLLYKRRIDDSKPSQKQ